MWNLWWAVQKALVIDPDVVCRDAHANVLVKTGHDCVLAKDANDAFYHLKTHKFHVVLSELKLPDGYVFPIADYLWARNHLCPMIVITDVRVRSYCTLRTLSPKIDFVLRKPADPTDLLHLVTHCQRSI